MKTQLDMEKIARGLGAERVGTVSSGGGYFNAQALAADVQARFRTPPGGGRATIPEWTERRLIPLTPEMLHRIEGLAAKLRERSGVAIQPMQLAGLLLEQVANSIKDTELEDLAGRSATKRRAAG